MPFTEAAPVNGETVDAAWHQEAHALIEGLEVLLAESGAQIAMRTTDSAAIASNIVPQDDSSLHITIEPNTNYVVSGYLVVTCASNTPGFRVDFTAPAGATMPRWSLIGQPAANTTTTGTIDTGASPALGTDLGRHTINGSTVHLLQGALLNGANAGTFQLRWAQLVSNINGVTLNAGSWLRLERAL